MLWTRRCNAFIGLCTFQQQFDSNYYTVRWLYLAEIISVDGNYTNMGEGEEGCQSAVSLTVSCSISMIGEQAPSNHCNVYGKLNECNLIGEIK